MKPQHLMMPVSLSGAYNKRTPELDGTMALVKEQYSDLEAAQPVIEYLMNGKENSETEFKVLNEIKNRVN